MKKILTLFSVLLSMLILVVACQEDDYIAPPNPGRMIKSFKLEQGQVGTELINGNSDPGKIVVKVEASANLTAIVPVIVLSTDATISPASGEPVDISVNRTITYTVTAASGEQKQWEVEFNVVDANLSDYGAYIIKSVASQKNLSIEGDTLYNNKYWDAAKIILETPNSDHVAGLKKYQKWHVIYHATTNDIKYYKIRNMFSGKFITAPSGDNTNTAGAQILQIGYNPTPVNENLELWKAEKVNGSYKFINKANGLVLTDLPATQIGAVAKAVQTAESTEDTQSWTLVPIQNEAYKDDVFNNFFERNETYMGSVAFDQGNSIPLTWGPNAGKVLWVTEDSYDGASLRDNAMFPCGQFFSYNNSILIQPSATDWDPTHTVNMTNTRATAHPRLMFDDTPGNDWIWPGTGVEIGDKVYMYAGEGQGLSNNQSAMYVLTQNSGTAWNVERRTPAGVTGASGWVKGGDGYVYAYQPEGFNFGYESYMHVARFPENDPDTWSFWNGSSWGAQQPTGSTGSVFTGLANNSVEKVNGKYVLMTVNQGFFCDQDRGKVYISTASTPTGPWTPKKLVYQITDYLNGKATKYYTVIIHPHSDNNHNELLLSFSVNYEACGQSNCSGAYLDPYYYRIKGIRVPYDLIGL